MITTKRHPFKFYLTIILGFIFFSSMGTFLIWTFVDEASEGEPRTLSYLFPLIGLSLIVLAFYTLKQYFKNAPIITIDRKYITFGDIQYRLDDITDIVLTGKMPFRYIIKFPMEGAALSFKNGTVKFLFDDMYVNTWKIKSTIEKTVIEKNEYKEPENYRMNPSVIRFEHPDFYKGFQLISFHGILLWGMVGFFLFFAIQAAKNQIFGFVIFCLSFSLFWFLVSSWLMNYFGITKDYFIVKNHNFFWMQKIYRLVDIKEIVFETHGNMPNCLRVITVDYRNKLYPGGTLRDKTWLKLKDQLEKLNITVRNECIY